jgi:hypothetical protein
MRAREKKDELIRLQKAFETEAAQFHDLSLSIIYLTQAPLLTNRVYKSPNHQIMLWQYYGKLDDPSVADKFVNHLKTSNLRLAGVRGSQFSCFALIEGPRVQHFVRMAV